MISDQINLILFIIYVCFGLFLSFIYSLQRDSPKIKFRSILLTLISINFQFITNLIILLIYLFSQFNISCNWYYWIGHLLIPNLALLQFFKLVRLIYLFWLSYIKLKVATLRKSSRKNDSKEEDNNHQVWWKRDKFTRNWIKIKPWFQSPLLVTQLIIQLGFNSLIIVIIQLIIAKFKVNIGMFITPTGNTQICSTPLQIYITIGEVSLFFILSWIMLICLLTMGIRETYGILIELVASLIILPIHLILCIILMYPGLFQLSEDYSVNLVYLNWFLSFLMFLIYLVPFIQPNLNLYKGLESYNNRNKLQANAGGGEGGNGDGLSKPKLETILKDPVMFLDFKRFAANHFCVENVLFFERYIKLMKLCKWDNNSTEEGGFGQSLSKLSSIGGATIIGASYNNLVAQNNYPTQLSPIHSPNQKELPSPQPESINYEIEQDGKNPIISDEVCIDEDDIKQEKIGLNQLNINIYNEASNDNIILLTPDGKSCQLPPFLSNKDKENGIENDDDDDDNDSDILPQFPEFNHYENNSSECVSLTTLQKLELKTKNPIIKEIQTMYQDFINPSSPLQLNLTASTRKQIQFEIQKLEKQLSKNKNYRIEASLLLGWNEIYEEVYNTLLLDTFPRYLKFLESVTKVWLQQKRV